MIVIMAEGSPYYFFYISSTTSTCSAHNYITFSTSITKKSWS